MEGGLGFNDRAGLGYMALHVYVGVYRFIGCRVHFLGVFTRV